MMSKIADGILDGTLCKGCGRYIGRDAGYPRYCTPECDAAAGAREAMQGAESEGDEE